MLKFSLPIYRYVRTPKWQKFVQAEDYFYSRAIQLVDDAILRFKDALEKKELKDMDFYLLSYFLSKPDLSLKDVTILCLSLFADGLSTTTPVILFNLYCLATNLESQDKIHQEIIDVIGDEKYITVEHIGKMPFLKAFVKETFRLFPNGTEVSRYTEKPVILSGYEIPTGMHVDFNPSVHFRSPELFSNPNKHHPERWIRDTNLEDKIHPYLLTPFGHGTRMCAGRRFAEQDIHILLTTVLRRFRLEYPIGEEIDQVYNTLLFPDRPVRVRFIKRSE